MGMRLNRQAYERLIAEDIEWLKKQPDCLERKHIIQVLLASPDHEYGKRPCPSCRGSGITEYIATQKAIRGNPCPDCRGTGRI